MGRFTFVEASSSSVSICLERIADLVGRLHLAENCVGSSYRKFFKVWWTRERGRALLLYASRESGKNEVWDNQSWEGSCCCRCCFGRRRRFSSVEAVEAEEEDVRRCFFPPALNLVIHSIREELKSGRNDPLEWTECCSVVHCCVFAAASVCESQLSTGAESHPSVRRGRWREIQGFLKCALCFFVEWCWDLKRCYARLWTLSSQSDNDLKDLLKKLSLAIWIKG